MDSLKRFVEKHFELLAILVVVIGMALIHLFVVQKVTFLNLYFIPVLFAGYMKGKRIAGLTALLCVFSVFVWLLYGGDDTVRSFALGARAVVEEAKPVPELPVTRPAPILLQKQAAAKKAKPDAAKKEEPKAKPKPPAPKAAKDAKGKIDLAKRAEEREKKSKAREVEMYREGTEAQAEEDVRQEKFKDLRLLVYTHVAAWGGFLFLSGVIVGALADERKREHAALRRAYVGILGIVSNYLETADKYMKGHMLRVSDWSTEIAKKLELGSDEAECVHAASLLHEMSKTGVNVDVIQRAATQSSREKEQMGDGDDTGSDVLAKMGDMLSHTVPILAAAESLEKKEAEGEGVPVAGQIIDLVDRFDTLVSEDGKSPQEALEELAQADAHYDKKLVEIAKDVLTSSKSVGEQG